MSSSTSLIPSFWPASTVEMMHALVPAVLLRMARRDALDRDVEPEPPHRELGKVEQGIGTGKGNAVVGTNGKRQTALVKQPLKGRHGRVFAR